MSLTLANTIDCTKDLCKPFYIYDFLKQYYKISIIWQPYGFSVEDLKPVVVNASEWCKGMLAKAPNFPNKTQKAALTNLTKLIEYQVEIWSKPSPSVNSGFLQCISKNLTKWGDNYYSNLLKDNVLLIILSFAFFFVVAGIILSCLYFECGKEQQNTYRYSSYDHSDSQQSRVKEKTKLNPSAQEKRYDTTFEQLDVDDETSESDYLDLDTREEKSTKKTSCFESLKSCLNSFQLCWKPQQKHSRVALNTNSDDLISDSFSGHDI